MKLKGKFILRNIMGEAIAIPVGDALLNFNGMIGLNAVGEVIWEGLQEEKPREEILQAILDRFDVSPEEAEADLEDFLHRLRQCDLLED